MVRLLESISVPLGAKWVHFISKSLKRYCVGFLTVKSATITFPNPSLRHLYSSFTSRSSASLGSIAGAGVGKETEFPVLLPPVPAFTRPPTHLRSSSTATVQPIPPPWTTSLFRFHFKRLEMI